MSWPATSEELVKIRQNARLPKAAFRLFLTLGVMVFLLLSPFSVLSETIQETEASTAGPVERSDEIGNQVSPVTGFVFEEPPADTNANLPAAVPPEPVDGLDPPREELPRIAIIIDDMGHHQQVGEELLDLDMNLTFSFLPHAPFTSGQAERARQLGRDILLHMPMEPRDPRWDPGPGALYLDATVESIVLAVEDNLA
ncbi:MAG TPA: divergent polysaccharide deacetylase family protein, partial [Desulfobacteraceae bacterium]|nr:divergent polysaccharide deacetylase family protein [Desulfobacteraceae bacterium]